MREFAIPYSSGLKRGLRKFPVSQRSEEWLYECYNLMPTEVGLVSHETIGDFGTLSTSYDYFALKDQDSVIWYLWIEIDQSMATDDSIPSDINGLDVNDLTPATIPYWLKILADDTGVAMYLYPSTIGTIMIDTAAPAIGTELDGGTKFQMSGRDAVKYYLKLLSRQVLLIDPV